MDDDTMDEKIEKAIRMELGYYQNSYEEAIENVSRSLKVDPERVKRIAAKIQGK